MKRIILAFKNCPRVLTLTSLISLFLFLCNVFWWMNLDPIFETAPKVAEIANIIFSAIITGHIFYAIVNQFKDNTDKENIRSIVSRSIGEIHYQNGRLFDEFMKVTNYVPQTMPLKHEEIQSILKNIETTQVPPSIVHGFPKPVNLTWYQLAQTSRQRVKVEINNLLRFSSLLDTELLGLLDRIERSAYFEMVDGMSIFGNDFSQFQVFADSYFEHQNLNLQMLKYALNENWLIVSNSDEKKMLNKLVTTGFSTAEIKETQIN